MAAAIKFTKLTKKFFKPNQITTIFFDLDNTLIPTRKGDLKACSKLAEYLQEQYGMSSELATMCTATFLKSFRRCPDNPSIPLDTWRCHLWEDSLPDTYKTAAFDIYKSWLQLRYRYVKLTDEFTNFLLSLRQHYLLGLITNGPSNAQWEKIQRLSLNKFFDCILVSDDLPWEKPDERIFFAACNYLGVQPKQCIMIGDKIETDIQGGIEAKLGGTIWIPLTNYYEHPPPPSEQGMGSVAAISVAYPDIIIQNLLDVEKFLPQSTIPESKIFRSRSSDLNGCMTSFRRRVASLPDLDSSNSNSSDGS